MGLSLFVSAKSVMLSQTRPKTRIWPPNVTVKFGCWALAGAAVVRITAAAATNIPSRFILHLPWPPPRSGRSASRTVHCRNLCNENARRSAERPDGLVPPHHPPSNRCSVLQKEKWLRIQSRRQYSTGQKNVSRPKLRPAPPPGGRGGNGRAPGGCRGGAP